MQDATPLPKSDLSLAEEELQNELRSMFELDTQTYLQTYEQVTQQLSTETWTENIQELYRSIHTIKGGAVTVGADAVLATTTALEEMLSDLRYLQSAPNLSDGALISVLVEAGEVVSGSLLITQDDAGGKAALTSALGRLSLLHDQVRDRFLTEIDEHQQICQDFANQGFDLMILDLEMALEQVPDGDQIPSDLVNTAAQIFTDLERVGQELEMEGGWPQLIQPLFELLIESDSEMWRSRSQTYLALLKNCALEAGKLTDEAKNQLQSDGFYRETATEPQAELPLFETEVIDFVDFNDESLPDFTAVSAVQDTSDPNVHQQDAVLSSVPLETTGEDIESDFDDIEAFNLGWLTDVAAPDGDELSSDEDVSLDLEALQTIALAPEFADLDLTEELPEASFDALLHDVAQPILDGETTLESHPEDVPDLVKEGQLLSDALKHMETLGGSQSEDNLMIEDDLAVPDNFLESLAANTQDVTETPDPVEMPTWVIDSPEPAPASTPQAIITKPASTPTKIPKIPVPLDRLERSSRALVEILLSARSTQGRYQSLQNQVVKMVTLSQESSAYITQLRQMQDDYALLQDLSHQSSNDGVKLEGYRSGYMAINRLLENNLRLSELGAEMAATAQVTKQEFSNLNLNIKALQSSVEESRLISFKSIAFRLRAVIQDLINRIGKPVNFLIEGEAQSIDAGTVQVLEPALLHLLRNAYDHGIESSEDRLKANKSEEATITLSLKQQGSFYHLCLVDDGKGIDRQKIASLAKSKGLPLTQTDTNDSLLQVICQPGFSSQTEVSAYSGRGVGMDVVNHQVQQIGGSLKLETTVGQGSLFDLKIPVPHLLVPCIVVKAGTQLFAIPTDAIQTMRLWDESCVRRDSDNGSIALPWEREFEGKIEPMMPIMQYWQEKWNAPDFDEAKMETAVCLRIPGNESGSEAIWIVIDDLVEELDLLIKTLPSPLKTPSGMLGMSTLPTGDMIPVLEASTIAQVIMTSEAQEIIEANLGLNGENDPTQAGPVNSNLILVVDDAALLRRRLEISLLNYGYEVQCCRDGLEAWNWLQNNPSPGLMITDIEMPQMDGLTLVDRCRQTGLSFPILVSSSRLSEEWSKEAKRVGANDYLTKGFSTNELIDRVSSLMVVPSSKGETR